MDINHVSSAPKYITDFISRNMEQLNKIYNEGISIDSNGILACKCSEKENRIDVQFTKEEIILQLMDEERWREYKNTTDENKKIIFIIDLDLNSIFLITV